MKIMHALSQIKPMCVCSELVAGHLNLRASKASGYTAGICQHLFPNALFSMCGVHGKLHNFRHTSAVVELPFNPEVQHPYYVTFIFTYNAIITPVGHLIPIYLRKHVKRQAFAFHLANQLVNPLYVA